MAVDHIARMMAMDAAQQGGGDAYTKAETDALLGAKQDALTTAQQNAVDSGIDSTTVGQIGTNTSSISAITDGTNIDSFADVETALGGKLDYAGTALSSGTDMNTLVEFGTYFRSSSTITVSNLPQEASSASGLIRVEGLNNLSNIRLTQIFIPNWGNTNVTGKIYIRQITGSEGGVPIWSAWYKFEGTAVT